jgi:hypothetical protein
MWIDMRSNGLINYTKKILCGHIGGNFAARAVTSTVETMDIATECGLPEQLLQRMQLLKILATQAL